MDFDFDDDVGADAEFGDDFAPSGGQFEKLVPEKHLDSPITTSLLERLQDIMRRTLLDQHNVRPTQYDPRRNHAVNRFLQKNVDLAYSNIRPIMMQYTSALDFCKLNPEILSARLYPKLFNYSNTAPYRLQTDFQLSKQVFKCELNAYLSQLGDILKPAQVCELREKLTPFNAIGEHVVLSSCKAQLWSDIVEDYRKLYGKHRSVKKREYGPLRVIMGDGFLLIKSDDLPRWQLMTFEQLQMIQDCCLGRHNIELALRFSFHNGTPRLATHVRDLFRWQESVLSSIGNDGYELVKAPEAIFKARLNTLTDGDLLTYSSYNRTLDKMIEKEVKLHKNMIFMKALDDLVQRVTDLHDAAELFGLSKLSGHPVVYAEHSADSVRKEAEPKGTIQPFAVRQMTRMFKHLTLSGYLLKHSSWPSFSCPPAHNTVLRRHYVNQVTSLPIGSYPISDIDAIRFDKFIEYDYSEDYLKFLDDKAICPGASEMSKFWYGGNKDESRRLLQKILTIKHFDTVELVERLRKGKFTIDEYVVELTQKERELKKAARCFCKLPFAVRTFFTSTEYNLKNFMGQYMPQQTMTMSNTETKQRMYNLVKSAKSKDRTLLEVDFSRWNLRWRNETVSPISSELEDIYGLRGVFSQAHPFFTRATVVLTDKHTLPEHATPSVPITQWKTSRLVWRGTHLGGFEGIQQALWTICTIAMMYWVLHDQNLSFNMAGQGDNQIFAITFDPSTLSMDMQLRKLLAIMEIRCKLLNHEVKPDECIDSRTVLTYSKDIYVDGNHILYNLKFASRTFKREDVDIPSLSTEISSISACSMACADSVYETPRAIFWKTFHTIRLLSARHRSPNYTPERSAIAKILNNSRLLEFVLLVPGSLGGLPAMAWSRFFMKGEVDDLSWDVPAIRALALDNRILAWDLNLTLSGEYTNSKPNLTQLILDPHSIPIERPRDMKKLVKEAVGRELPGITKNVWLRQIFDSSTESAGNALMERLTTTRPFYPEIMSDIYSLSPSGVRDAMISRFTATRTITGITGNPKFASQILSSNAALLTYLIGRFERASKKRGIASLPPSAYDTCAALRKLWGEHVHHRNIGVYNPFDFKLKFTDTSLPMISASSRSTSDSLHSSLGPYPPNFGTKTKQKVSDHGFKIITSSSTVGDLKKLIMTYSELGATPEFGRIITDITRARSPWTVQQLLTVLPTSYGGSAAHRHAAINATAFSLLGSRTVPTHLNFCSDLAGKLSGGEFDYPIAFQEFYLSLTNLFQVLTKFGVLDSNASIGFSLTDDYEALPTEPVTSTVQASINWRPLTGNKLCYVSALQVSEIPTVPPQTQIVHVLAPELRPATLIYNRLLAKYTGKRRLFKTTSSINLPIELIDMKEFAHCPLGELIRGSTWFIQVMALHTTICEFTRNAATFFLESVMHLSRACGSILARTMLHPSFSDSLYAVETGVICNPGISGARDAADSLAGELYHTVLSSVRAREMIIEDVPLVLFADYGTYANVTSEMHATALVALQSYNTSQILVTPYQWLMLRSARHTIIEQQRALNIAMNFRSTVNEMSKTTSYARSLRTINATLFKKMNLVYCNSIPEEAIRALRSLPTDIRSRVITTDLPELRFGGRDGWCVVEEENVDGSLKPTHVCETSSDSQRIVDNFLSLLTRPLGRHSSALSVWLSLFKHVRGSVKGSSVLAIGVGHGASSTAALMHGAMRVEGIDLRASFPCISQRETTYKPPEIIEAGYQNKFSWSKFVSQTGGDAVKNADQLKNISGFTLWVIDIEQEHSGLQQVLANVPSDVTLVIRILCCKHWAEFYSDAVQADILINTSAVRSTHIQSYILIKRRFGLYNPNANYHRRTIISTSPYLGSVVRHSSYSLFIINGWIKKYGYTLKVLSASALNQIRDELITRSYNCNDPELASFLLEGSAIINEVTTNYLNHQSLTGDVLLLMRRASRRLLAQWLANTNLDLQSIKDKILLSTAGY